MSRDLSYIPTKIFYFTEDIAKLTLEIRRKHPDLVELDLIPLVMREFQSTDGYHHLLNAFSVARKESRQLGQALTVNTIISFLRAHHFDLDEPILGQLIERQG